MKQTTFIIMLFFMLNFASVVAQKKNGDDDIYLKGIQFATDYRVKNSIVTRDYSFDNKVIQAKPVKNIELRSKTKLIVGQKYYLLQVSKAEDLSLIGCKICCEVIERRKSNISGAEGRLIIRPLYVEKNDHSVLHLLPTDIHRRGLNRQSIKFWTSPLIIPIFVPGTGAKILPNEVFDLRLE